MNRKSMTSSGRVVWRYMAGAALALGLGWPPAAGQGLSGSPGAVANGGSGWESLANYQGELMSATALGFVGDGATDNTAAIGRLVALTGSQRVYFPPGIYGLASCPAGWSIASNLSIVGAGKNITVLRLPPACNLSDITNTAILLWQNGSHGNETGAGFTVSGITLDLNSATNSGASVIAPLAVAGHSHFAIRDSAVIDAGGPGFALIGLTAGTAGIADFEISGNYLQMSAASTAQNQCLIVSAAGGGGVSGGKITHNICANSGMDINANATTIGENQISGWNFGGGITTEQSSNCYNLTIADNQIYNGGTALDTNSTAALGIENWCPQSVIARNTVHNNGGDGIDNGGANSVVADNALYANGKRADGHKGNGLSTLYASASINGNGSNYSGNLAYDDGSGDQLYGYADQSSSVASIALAGNRFCGNATAPINPLGSNVHFDAASNCPTTQAASTSASRVFYPLPKGKFYEIRCVDLTFDTNSIDLLFQSGEGAGLPSTGWVTSGYFTTGSANVLASGVTTYASGTSSGIYLDYPTDHISNLQTAADDFEVKMGDIGINLSHKVWIKGSYQTAGGGNGGLDALASGDSNPWAALRIIPTSGNILSGACMLTAWQ